MSTPLNLDQALVDRIIAALDGMRFGSVEITVHDARIVQIERKEKVRFSEPPARQDHERAPRLKRC